MLNNRKFAIFDLETDSKYSDKANIVELSCIIIDPIKAQIMPNSLFSASVKPDAMTEENYFENHKDTIEWHAKLHKCSTDDILAKWSVATPEKQVWESFEKYLKQYHITQDRHSSYTAPVPCGFNIINYDLPIMARYAEKYKTKCLFSPVFKVDAFDILWLWFEGSSELDSIGLDAIRDYFGMSKANAHTAKQDVLDTAEIVCRLINLHRKQFSKVQFKGSFKNA